MKGRTEPQPQVTCTEDFMQFGFAFLDYRSGRQTSALQIQTLWYAELQFLLSYGKRGMVTEGRQCMAFQI